MKIIDFLTESADTDVIYSKIVDRLRVQLYGYLYDAMKRDPNFELPIAVYQGEEIPCIVIREVVKGGPFQDVMVMFRHTEGYGLTGKAVAWNETRHGCNYCVIIDALGTTTQQIATTLLADRTAAIFQHEFIHIMDFKRYKGDIFKREGANGPRYSEDDPEEKKKAERERYYNSPEELNAFFHNLAEPLLNRHRFVKDDPESAEFFDALPDSFTDYLGTMTKKLYGEHKRFWEHLSQQNRRKITSRLYRLFQDYQRRVLTVQGGAQPS